MIKLQHTIILMYPKEDTGRIGTRPDRRSASS
jgi:hypothetical protein